MGVYNRNFFSYTELCSCMEEYETVDSGKEIINERVVRAEEICCGAIVHAYRVEVEDVSTGAVVIAREVRDLRDVSSGGVVITDYSGHRVKPVIRHTADGHFESIDEYLEFLMQEKIMREEEGRDDRAEKVEEKISMMENVRERLKDYNELAPEEDT